MLTHYIQYRRKKESLIQTDDHEEAHHNLRYTQAFYLRSHLKLSWNRTSVLLDQIKREPWSSV